MEPPNPKLHRSDIELHMPPRWGFSSFGVGGYNYGAPPELKNGSSTAARTTALIRGQGRQGESEPGSDCMDAAKVEGAIAAGVEIG